MFKKYIKYISVILTPIIILVFLGVFSVAKLPNRVFVENDTIRVDSELQESTFINTVKLVGEKIEVKMLGMVPIKTIPVIKTQDLQVYVGGTNIGVKLNTEGVLVVGFSQVNLRSGTVDSPAKTSGIELGDILLKVDNKEIESSKDLAKKIQSSDKDKINIELLREGKSVKKDIKLIKEDDEYKIGLWVRDSTAGIGTLTFYHEETSRFGALGHPITDGDTNKIFSIKKGELVESSVISVRRGEQGIPGELKGMFINDKNTLATIEKNTETGIYGITKNKFKNELYPNPMKVGFREDIKEGPAKIITTIDETGPKEYDIEIIKMLDQDKPGPKSMVIKVVDPVLLEKTGGIVQGMSGSPIIQNNKIIGAVTHVLVNKPEVGYGIYIEWMLKDADIIK